MSDHILSPGVWFTEANILRFSESDVRRQEAYRCFIRHDEALRAERNRLQARIDRALRMIDVGASGDDLTDVLEGGDDAK